MLRLMKLLAEAQFCQRSSFWLARHSEKVTSMKDLTSSIKNHIETSVSEEENTNRVVSSDRNSSM